MEYDDLPETYDNRAATSDQSDQEDEHVNEIAKLNPRLAYISSEMLLGQIESQVYNMWYHLIVPMLEEMPYGVVNSLNFADFWDFLMAQSYGLDKLEVQRQIDELRYQASSQSEVAKNTDVKPKP